MRLVVVDPRLLVRAFAVPKSPPAKLLALLAYGRICAYLTYQVDAHSDVEYQDYGTAEGRPAEESRKEAKRRKDRLGESFAGWPPEDFLLVTSPGLRLELAYAAKALQPKAAHLRPDRVLRHTAAHTWRVTGELGPSPFYLGEKRVSEREYLIQTAAVAEARFLVTNDPQLQNDVELPHHDEKLGRYVVAHTLDDLVSCEVDSSLDFDGTDAPAVLRKAIERLPDSTSAGQEDAA